MKLLGRWNTRRARIWAALLGFGLVIGVVVCVAARMPQSDKWVVPDAAKAAKNPVPATPAALSAAKLIYAEKCDRCHGDTGKGDGMDAMMYDPPPGDLTDPKVMNAETDGELYYKITKGRRPMPAFGSQLSDQQRWQLVDLLRSFVTKPEPSSSAKPGASGAAKSPAKK